MKIKIWPEHPRPLMPCTRIEESLKNIGLINKIKIIKKESQYFVIDGRIRFNYLSKRSLLRKDMFEVVKSDPFLYTAVNDAFEKKDSVFLARHLYGKNVDEIKKISESMGIDYKFANKIMPLGQLLEKTAKDIASGIKSIDFGYLLCEIDEPLSKTIQNTNITDIKEVQNIFKRPINSKKALFDLKDYTGKFHIDLFEGQMLEDRKMFWSLQKEYFIKQNIPYSFEHVEGKVKLDYNGCIEQ